MNNQKGFSLVEGLLIVVILLIVGFGGYTVWSNQQNSSSDTSSPSKDSNNTAANPHSQESAVKTSSHSLEKVGLDIELQDGWNVSKSNEKDGSQLSETYIVSSNDSDLSVNFKLATFLGGFADCEPGEIKTNKNKYMSEVVVSEPVTGYADYHILGTKEANTSTDTKDTAILLVASSQHDNWYDINGDFKTKVKAKNLVKGKKYTTCISLPSAGFSLDSPIKASLDEQSSTLFSIGVTSKSNTIARHMDSNTQDFQDVMNILKSLKPTN